MLDQDNFIRRESNGDLLYIPPYRDLRKPPVRKASRWPMVAVCAAACVIMLIAVLGPV